MAGRLPRTKDDQLVIRVASHTKEAFQSAAEKIAEAVGAADGSKLGQSNIFEYFMTWLAEQPYADQTNFVRSARRVFQDVQERRETGLGGGPQADQPSGPDSPPETIGGHTRGHRISIDDLGKPRQTRPGGRADRKKMGAKLDGGPLL